MTLIDERELKSEQERRAKLFKIIIRAIIILVILVAVLLICVGIIRKNAFKCIVDGTKNTSVSSNILCKDSKGKVYIENGQAFISIKELAKVLGYQICNNEYKCNGEDKSKLYVQVNNIYTSYIAGSNNIYRAIASEKKSNDKVGNTKNQGNDGFQEIEDVGSVEFEYFTVSDKVKCIGDELYASEEAIRIGFDALVQYDKSNNKLTIVTLNKLEEQAKAVRADVVPSSEYAYKNKRLLKYGLAVVKDSQGNYGVASYTNKDKIGTYLASCKYSSINFNEATSTIATVTNGDKKAGLLHINLANQEVEKSISSEYQELREITNNFDYFLVKQEGKYGIINKDGNTVVPVIFDKIGIKEQDYTNITCKYILGNKYVPVKQNGKWGLYSLEGKQLIEPKYEDVGCNLRQNGDSVVYIPNIKQGVNGIVFLYNRAKSFYGVYNADTGERIAVSLTEVFKKTENGEDNYYINHIIDRLTSKAHTLNVKKDL